MHDCREPARNGIIPCLVKRPVVIALALTALLAAMWEVAPVALEDRPATHRRPADAAAPLGRYVIGAAGDIACEAEPNGPGARETCQYGATADLIEGTGLTEVLPLGDNQYDVDAFAAYRAYFDPTWGRVFEDLSPVPGNHEYDNDPTSRPGGYFRYFGDRAKGPHRLGYYSYDLGACPNDPCWHLIALNSELCFAPGGCGRPPEPDDPGSGHRMYRWLRRDLAGHPDAEYPCTLAYWHHPLFSFSTGSGASAAVRPLWELLHAASADVVLNGHSHNYQRWRPLDPSGAFDPEGGIRQFIVGTGGASLYAVPGGKRPANLAAAQDDAFGILRIALKAERFRWAWVTAAGQPAFEDASRHGIPCVRATP